MRKWGVGGFSVQSFKSSIMDKLNVVEPILGDRQKVMSFLEHALHRFRWLRGSLDLHVPVLDDRRLDHDADVFVGAVRFVFNPF